MLFFLSSSIVFRFIVHSVLNDLLTSFKQVACYGVFGARKIMGVTRSNYGSSCKIRFRFAVGTDVTPYRFCFSTLWQPGRQMSIVTRLRAGKFGVGNVIFSITSYSLLFLGYRGPFYFFGVLFIDDYDVSGLLTKGISQLF
jgi:hypothetical protein